MSRLVNFKHPFEETKTPIESNYVVAVWDFHGGIRLNAAGVKVETFQSPIDISLILTGRPGKLVVDYPGDAQFMERSNIVDKLIDAELRSPLHPAFENFSNFVAAIANDSYLSRERINREKDLYDFHFAQQKKKSWYKSGVRQTRERIRSGTAIKVVKVKTGQYIFDKVYTLDAVYPGIMEITYASGGVVIKERYHGDGVTGSFAFSFSNFVKWLASRGVRKAVFFDQSCNGFCRPPPNVKKNKKSHIEALRLLSPTLGRRMEKRPGAATTAFNQSFAPTPEYLKSFADSVNLQSDEEGEISNSTTKSSEPPPPPSVPADRVTRKRKMDTKNTRRVRRKFESESF